MSAILRIFDATDGVRDFVVCGDQLVLGRDKSKVDICINDMTVSRVHMKIFLRDGLYYIEDLESSCGTLVNNRLVKTQKLFFGDHIQMGNTVIEFLSNDDGKSVPQSSTTDTVDELMTQYRVLPSKMDLFYRVLRVPARSIYSPGDTIIIGRGGLLVNIDLAPEDSNFVLELKVIWPDGTSKIFLGEIIATIKKARLVCVKLHHVSDEKMNSMFEKMERGGWNKVVTP